jgi:putative transposase
MKRRNQVWVSDTTYIETTNGRVYLAVIIDLFDRKVIAWSLSEDMTAENTIIKDRYAAVENRPINEKLIFHSDRGSQYASTTFRNTLKSDKKHVKQSIYKKGDSWGNSVAEGFFKSLKT